MSFSDRSAPTQSVKNESDSQEEDVVWGLMVPFRHSHLEMVRLCKDVTPFGRNPTEGFSFDRKKHRLRKSEFFNISKEHFVITKDQGDVFITDKSSNGTFLNGGKIPKDTRIPLSHNTLIAINVSTRSYFVFLNKVIVDEQIKKLPAEFSDLYTLQHCQLGRGKFGRVVKAYKNDCRREVAVKIISKIEEKEYNYEFAIVKNLSHENIVKIYNFFENESECFIVMEYASGGDLHRYIKTNGVFGECEAKPLFKQVTEGVQYLHTQKIVHRDVKPENILLFYNDDNDVILKLADFGFSRILSENSVMKSYKGTPAYCAPEIRNSAEGYTCAVDVWSLGCVFCVMLVGCLPFTNILLSMEMLRNIRKELFHGEGWKKVSADGQNLCSGMLTLEPLKRLAVSQILSHCWFESSLPPSKRLRTE